MLQHLRAKTSGRIASACIVIVALAVGLWGIQGVFEAAYHPHDVARVGRAVITGDHFREALQHMRLMETGAAWAKIQADPQRRSTVRQQLLNQMIFKLGALDGLDKYRYYLDDSVIQETLAQLPPFQVNGQFSFDRYQAILTQMGLSEAEVLTDIRLDLLTQYLHAVLRQSTFLLNTEAAFNQSALLERRDVGFFVIKPALKETMRHLTDTQIQSYYTAHRATFKQPPTVSLHYIEVPFSTVRGTLNPSQQTLRAAYREQSAHFRVPARYQGTQVWIRPAVDLNTATSIKKMKQLFKQLSLTDQAQEALIKHFKQGMWTVRIEPTATWRTVPQSGPISTWVQHLKPGQISALKTLPEHHYTFFKLKAFQPEFVRPFQAVAQQLRSQLIQQQFQQKLSIVFEKLAERVYTEPKTLQPAAQQFKVSVRHFSSLREDQQPKKGVFAEPIMWKLLFGADQPPVGENSEVIALKDRWVIFNIQSITPARVPSLEAIKQKVQQYAAQDIAYKRAEKMVHKIQHLLDQGRLPAYISKKLNHPWQEKHALSQNAYTHANQKYWTQQSVNQIFQHPEFSKAVIIQLAQDTWMVLKILKVYQIKSTQALHTQFKLLEDRWMDQLATLELGSLRQGLLLDRKIEVFMKPEQLSTLS